MLGPPLPEILFLLVTLGVGFGNLGSHAAGKDQ